MAHPQGNTAQNAIDAVDTLDFIKNKVCFLSFALIDIHEANPFLGDAPCSGLQQILGDIQEQLDGVSAAISQGGAAA